MQNSNNRSNKVSREKSKKRFVAEEGEMEIVERSLYRTKPAVAGRKRKSKRDRR